MQPLFKHLLARPRFYAALGAGALVALLIPATVPPTTRALIGWNAAVWSYLAAMIGLMAHADHERFRSVAAVHAEGAVMVLFGAVCAVSASLAAIVMELGDKPAWPHVLLALVTLVGCWLLLPTLFALSYASVFFRQEPRGSGMEFPGDEQPPDYADFMYFAVTIAATSQTSDVAVTTRAMRRWVTAHALLSFAFNTTLLALAINIAAGQL